MEHTPVIALIAALADNRVIGRHNRLPWHLPADLRHFKQLTLDKPIIMGRNTWESLPGLLPRRSHIVISRDPAYRAEGCILVTTPDAAIEAAGDVAEIMVVGGATIYRQMLSRARRMYLTLVHGYFEGDALFPAWSPAEWSETEREDFSADDDNRYSFSFVTLERQR
jgi:dihydrofolate reductase